MNSFYRALLLVLLAAVFGVGGVLAQESTTLPASYRLEGVSFNYQNWNNCGPATIRNALSFFGYSEDQGPAAAWLKPNYEDKNVSPWQMVEWVNTQVPGTTRAMYRYNGTIDLLKTLVASDFPVIIEEGYDPESDPQGWMGHYLLIGGYDDGAQTFYTYDSYIGPNTPYTYDHIDEFWRHFNRVYIVVYDISREAEVMAILGEDADQQQNVLNALERARAEAVANPEDPFAWFNMGTNFVELGMYQEAAVAYDQARNVGGGLPWRMLWYQFGPFEAYLNVGRHQDVIALAQANLNDGGGQYVEETFYYAGLAREALGELDRARDNFQQAVYFNPNFSPAVNALERVQTQVASAG
jgi:tetratricopeptide (TPR) repeat protein